jgi:hypothetical protein
LDIGRGKWKFFDRTVEQYFSNFRALLDLFIHHPDASQYDFVVFLDYTLVNKMPSSLPSNIHVVPIDETYMGSKCPLWQRMDREMEIMASAAYQTLIRHRLHHPEHSNPKYTLINHCKIDVVREAMDIVPRATHYAWVDFGFCQVVGATPSNFLDLGKLDADRVNYTLINPIDPSKDNNIVYTLQYAPEKVIGGFFCGSKQSLLMYRELYHDTHRKLQAQNIVDDDQHIALLCYLQKPELFRMHLLASWNAALNAFSK